jgi:colanic acid/amylovoran biosynthesis glycosyltransferase
LHEGTVLHYKTNFLNRSETFIHRLVSNHERYRPSVLCYRKREFTEGFELFAVPETGLSALRNVAAFHLNRPLPFYREIVGQVKPDVIHSHFGYDAHKLIRIADNARVPHVVSFYGSDVSRLPDERGWKRRYRTLASHGSWFIAASRYMKAQLIALGFPEERISIIRFGLNPDQFRFRKDYELKPSFLMAGRLVEKKGFEFGLKAIAEVISRGIPATVSIYGDGPLMPYLKNLTKKLGITGRVTFHGFRPVDEILEAHSAHSFMLVPSVTARDGDMEGLPNTVLEALALGTPVITTRHAAIPEVVEDGISGFLTDERDVNGLAEVITRLIENADRESMEAIRREARKRIEREYTVQKMVAGVEQVYDEVMKSSSLKT